MTKNQFAALCAEFGIDPGVALESDEVRNALRERNIEEVKRILREEF